MRLKYHHVHEHVHEIGASSWTSHHNTAALCTRVRPSIGQALINRTYCQFAIALPIPNNIANCRHCRFQFIAVQLPALPIQFDSVTSGVRNMGEVRNHNSRYLPSISSIWPIATAGGRNVGICQQHLQGQHRLPTTSVSICQHLSASASVICRHLLLAAIIAGQARAARGFLVFVLFGTIYAAMASNSQHLNRQPASQWPQHLGQHLKHLSQDLASI
jgi:hypothetical protein